MPYGPNVFKFLEHMKTKPNIGGATIEVLEAEIYKIEGISQINLPFIRVDGYDFINLLQISMVDYADGTYGEKEERMRIEVADLTVGWVR